TGSATLSHDRVELGSISLRTGSAAVSARLRRTWQTWAVEGGIGARLAVSRVKATAADTLSGLWQEHAFTGTWGGPTAEIRFGWKPARGVFVVAALEGGTVTGQLTGLVAKQPETVIAGPWASLSLGIGLGTDAPLSGP